MFCHGGRQASGDRSTALNTSSVISADIGADMLSGNGALMLVCVYVSPTLMNLCSVHLQIYILCIHTHTHLPQLFYGIQHGANNDTVKKQTAHFISTCTLSCVYVQCVRRLNKCMYTKTIPITKRTAIAKSCRHKEQCKL